MSGMLDDLDRRREEVARDRENSARMAQSYATFTTNGQGTFHYEKRVPFGLTFVEKPVVSYCSELDVDDLGDKLDYPDDDVPLPVCAGFVTAWDQDQRDFYLGCWVAVRVNFPTIDAVNPEAQPEIDHHFTFSAVGMKDIPVDRNDAGE